MRLSILSTANSAQQFEGTVAIANSYVSKKTFFGASFGEILILITCLPKVLATHSEIKFPPREIAHCMKGNIAVLPFDITGQISADIFWVGTLFFIKTRFNYCRYGRPLPY